MANDKNTEFSDYLPPETRRELRRQAGHDPDSSPATGSAGPHAPKREEGRQARQGGRQAENPEGDRG